MRRLVVELRIWLVRFPFALASLLPIRDRVVLASRRGASDLRGNLEFVHDELARSHHDVEVVVLSESFGRGPTGFVRDALFALRAAYHLATARVFVVDDYFFPIYVVRPRPGTSRVQVWHACGAFKKFGYSALETSFGADRALVGRVRIHTNYDVCLVSSRSFAPYYAEAFRQPLELFRSDIGIPRTDVFLDQARRDEIVARLQARYAIRAGRRVILYAPTFRGDSLRQARAPENLDLERLCERIGSGYLLLVRLHPHVRSTAPLGPELAGFAIDVSDAEDINELMLVSDILVTDYSSAIFEFSLLGRPMAFFAPDFEAYERERGLYVDMKTWAPGPIFETTDELADWILAGDFDLGRVERFRRDSFEVADGHASERFVERLVMPRLEGRT